jgi:hypothetical protein
LHRPKNPIAEDYENERWLSFQPSDDKILILREDEEIDEIVTRSHKTSVPWGLIVAEIPIHYWLRKSKTWAPDLAFQKTHASLIAQAPQLLVLNKQLNDKVSLLEIENELLKSIIQRGLQGDRVSRSTIKYREVNSTARPAHR